MDELKKLTDRALELSKELRDKVDALNARFEPPTSGIPCTLCGKEGAGFVCAGCAGKE